MQREVALVLIAGLFSWLAVPALLGKPTAVPLLFIGLFLGMTYMPLTSLAMLGAKRMPAAVRLWIGIFSWLIAFGNALMLVAGTHGLTPAALYLNLAPALFGLAATALAALRAPRGERAGAASWVLYLYSLPMLIVVWLLGRWAIGGSDILSAIAVQGGAIYLFVRVLLRILVPAPVDQEHRDQPLLQRHPVPDFVVGLVEGTLRRAARPYATTAAGLDESAISVLCKPDEVDAAVQRLVTALTGHPFAVARGEAVAGKVEVVVRRQA